MTIARGTFEVQMMPGEAEVAGAVGRFTFTKTFDGELTGTGAGIMLSAGNPQDGEAGYVAIETVEGRLDGRDGGFALQQFGLMHDGEQTQHYAVVPGSGHGELIGITGTLDLTIEADGTHRYDLDFTL